MGTHKSILKTLRAIALDHASATQPDLASMARDLGCVVHRDALALAERLARLRPPPGGGLGRWQLAGRGRTPDVLLLAWPPNHCTPLQEHAGRWGLEMTLVGALELQSFRRDEATGRLGLSRHDWLGPGDSAWFEADQRHARRCRNLSRHDIALSLHVHGGDPASWLADAPATRRGVALQRHAFAGRLHG